MHRLTRREFLEIAGRQSIRASLAATALLAACRSSEGRPSALGLTRESADDLIDLIDEIIPASEGMPAASQTGAMSYLEHIAASEPRLAETVQESLATMGTLATDHYGDRFSALARDRRQRMVAAFAESSPDQFGALRTYVYEGYYLQPRVWQLLGYEPYPTSGTGPSMAPFDATILSRVRAMSPLWRQI